MTRGAGGVPASGAVGPDRAWGGIDPDGHGGGGGGGGASPAPHPRDTHGARPCRRDGADVARRRRGSGARPPTAALPGAAASWGGPPGEGEGGGRPAHCVPAGNALATAGRRRHNGRASGGARPPQTCALVRPTGGHSVVRRRGPSPADASDAMSVLSDIALRRSPEVPHSGPRRHHLRTIRLDAPSEEAGPPWWSCTT